MSATATPASVEEESACPFIFSDDVDSYNATAMSLDLLNDDCSLLESVLDVTLPAKFVSLVEGLDKQTTSNNSLFDDILQHLVIISMGLDAHSSPPSAIGATPFTPVGSTSQVHDISSRFSSIRRSCLHRLKISKAMGTNVVLSLGKPHDPESLSYLSQKDVVTIDELLMGPIGFSVDQFMELAGLSVAMSIAGVYKCNNHSQVLTLCGLGNNGSDGLLEALCISFLQVEDLPTELASDFDIVVSSFHDIPSDWHVEEGDIEGTILKPDMLVSLIAPKLCAKKFKGTHHFLRGKFVPPTVANKYSLRLPQYPSTSMCVRVGKPQSVNMAALREDYVSPNFLEENVKDDPIKQLQEWFEEAIATGLQKPNALTLVTADKMVTLLRGWSCSKEWMIMGLLVHKLSES